VTLVVGAVGFGSQNGMLFWVMTAVFYSGEGIVRAIDKLRTEGKQAA
jgi:hypothetical protein